MDMKHIWFLMSLLNCQYYLHCSTVLFFVLIFMVFCLHVIDKVLLFV